MGKSAPPVPDYRAAAEETAQASREATTQQNYANRPDQFSPFGSLTYNTEAFTDPATGQKVTKYTQNQELNPESQAALDSQLALTRGRSDLGGALMERVASDYGQPMDFSKYGDPNMGYSSEQIDMSDLPEGVGSLDYSDASEVGQSDDYRNRAEDAMYSRRASRLDPQFQGRQEALEVKLNNQGLRPGDQAYDSAMQNLGMERTDAYNAAQNEAIMSGGAEASRMFGMDMSRRGQDISETKDTSNFQNAARNRALTEQMTIKDRAYDQQNLDAERQNAIRTGMMNEELTRRGTSLNEMNAIISGQQVNNPQMAGFESARRAGSADYSGAVSDRYNAELAANAAKNSALGGVMGGLGSLGSAGINAYTGGLFGG